MKKKPRLFDLHLATWILAVVVACIAIFLNTRSISSDVLGHVSSDEPPIRPGIWVFGDSYGWPWVYRIDSFKTEAIAITSFDQLYWLPLLGNIAVATVTLVAITSVVEYLVRRNGAAHSQAIAQSSDSTTSAEPTAAPDRGGRVV